jgi:hypothetical protein
MAAPDQDDVEAIRAIVARQFASLSWSRTAGADWDGFAGDFLPGAPLYPAARPVAAKSVPAFVERMRGLAETSLPALAERMLGCEIRVFGKVAVAVAACEMTENEAETSRTVEMLLLVKEAEGWKIAAQAWDKEGPGTPIPAALLEPSAAPA